MQMIKNLFESKKFVVALGSIITIVAGELGLDLSETTVNWIAGIASTFIFGQGLADIGKEKAKAEAAAKAAAE